MSQEQNVNVQANAPAKTNSASVAAEAAKQAKKRIAKQKAAKAPKENKAYQKKAKNKIKPNYVAKKSAWYCVNPFLVLTFLVLAIWAAAPLIKKDIPTEIWQYGLIAFGALFAIAFLIFLGKVLMLKTYKIMYYDNKVVCQHGFPWNRHERTSAFLGATSVVVDRSLGGLIFNYGDVYIDTIGKWDIDTTYIKKPKKLKAYLEQRLITNSMVSPLIGE